MPGRLCWSDLKSTRKRHTSSWESHPFRNCNQNKLSHVYVNSEALEIDLKLTLIWSVDLKSSAGKNQLERPIFYALFHPPYSELLLYSELKSLEIVSPYDLLYCENRSFPPHSSLLPFMSLSSEGNGCACSWAKKYLDPPKGTGTKMDAESNIYEQCWKLNSSRTAKHGYLPIIRWSESANKRPPYQLSSNAAK